MVTRLRSLVAYALWPVVFVGTLMAAAWGFDRYNTALWAFVVSAANVIVIVGLELTFPRIATVNLFRDRQVPNDIGHGILVAGFGRTLGGPLAAGLIALLGYIQPFSLGAGWPSHWRLGAQVALGLVLWSLPSYWTHRWFHRIERLWAFHSVHHDADEMHVLKGNRIHVGEDLSRQLVMLLPLYALGVPARVLLWISMWNNVEGALAHSNIDVRFPSWAHWIFSTPANHYLHHAIEEELHDANFAAVTPLWDVLFGTYKHPDRHVVRGVGIEHSPVPEGFAAQVLFPMRRPIAVA